MTDNGALVAVQHGLTRSPHWPTVEHHFLTANPCCAASGLTKGVQAHHIAPFHFCILVGRPDLELYFPNLVPLSESEKGLSEVNYHLLLGHAGDFQSSNMDVLKAVMTFKGATTDQIMTSSIWQAMKLSRCQPWAQWTNQQKTDFRVLLDTLYPLPTGVSPEQHLALLVTDLTTRHS